MVPIILAGGSGTRLWPLSRKNFPKQFLCLQGQRSLLQQTLARAQSLPADEILVISNDAHYFLCQEQLQSESTPLTYLLEPVARNTAPAMACCARFLLEKYGDNALMVVMPSDHLIVDTALWNQAMLKAVTIAQAQKVIVTFGIKPTSPNTGYGYIQAGKPDTSEVFHVDGFHEKPDRARAMEMLADADYFWNSGMLVCRADVYLQELERYAPDIVACANNAVSCAYRHHDYVRLDEQSLSNCRSESNDYALMERTSIARLMPLHFAWSDLGCWNAVSEAHEKNADGNILSGKVITKDSQNCYIRSEHALVTALGLEDKIIVATHDAILIADKAYSQQVKEMVESVRINHQEVLDDHPRVPRPWGYYEILAEGASFKVKRLMVKPGSSLSLQLHQHRAEHWVVVAGTADIINGHEEIRLTVNESTYIPKQTKHRLSNNGDLPLFVIEVQSGEYLGEDDIMRLEDKYQRKVAVF